MTATNKRIDTRWRAARDRLATVSGSAALDAQVLLTDVLGAHDRAYLFAHPEQELTDDQAAQYAALVERRLTGEPIAYIRGFQAWYDRDIIVTPDVLIPRPETELLLEAALAVAEPGAVVADVCTGSGALAVTLAAHIPGAAVYGTDISPAALAVARRNTAASGVTVDWREGDLLKPLADLKLDILVSNPPYIAYDELQTLEVVKHEPSLALDGGADGLAFVRRLLAGVREVCKPGAWLFIEHGADQGAAVLALAHALLGPLQAEIVKDYAGLDRFLRAKL